MSLDPISAVFDGITTIVNKIWPDASEEQKTRLQIELAQLQASTDLAKGQLAINQVEASNANLFVAGWRPLVGWCCGLALAYNFIIQPFIIFILIACGSKFDYHTLPVLDTAQLNNILLGMLGMGLMRSAEKFKGVA